MATLTVTTTKDFRGGPAETNITDIVFASAGPGSVFASFAPTQFGAGLISNTVHVTGDAFTDVIQVVTGSAVTFSAAGWTFENWSSNDRVVLFDSDENDNLIGSSQNDTIVHTEGVDQIGGGDGDDFIDLDLAGVVADGTTFDGGTGTDTIRLVDLGTFDLTDATISDVEALTFIGDDPPILVTTAVLLGSQIGTGAITEVEQSSGTDALQVRGSSVDLSGVTFVSWSGDDIVEIDGTSTLFNTLVGSNQDDDISGGAFNAADTITGGLGVDALSGGGGLDAFRYLSGAELASGEIVDGGTSTDTIRLENAGAINFGSATITDVETLDFFSGTSTATLDSDQIGSGEIVTVSGSGAVDKLVVTVVGTTDLSAVNFNTWTNGTDSVTVNGSAAGNLITGTTQNDTVKGGGGTDVMDGKAGADTADYSDKTAAVVVALNGATSVLVTVGGAVEDAIQNFENVNGGSGADTLAGDGLANTLQGGSGNDTLKGGAGADTLNGGNDIDTADYQDKTAAVVVTLKGGTFTTVTVGGVGEDTIKNIENVNGGSGADKLTGDGLGNVLQGGNGDDTLKGGSGTDTLNGGGGSDVADYRDKTAAVEVTLNGGSFVTVKVGGVAEDTIKNIESMVGGTAGDSLTGDANANLLVGREGNDTLTGAAGADTYAFTTALNATTNVDHLTDFAAEDTIDLENGIFTAFATSGTLSANAFFSAAGATAAHDADDRIVYDTTTGALFYDADGIGGTAAVEFAVLDNHAALTNADFVVV